MHNTLTAFWRELSPDSFPRIHPSDFEILKNHPEILSTFKTWKDYVEGRQWNNVEERQKLQVSLVPVPYTGNLETAQIIILMLNPGFVPMCHWAETQNKELTSQLWENLYQQRPDFLFLDPHLSWYPGFTYWASRFQKTAEQIAAKQAVSYPEALRILSTKVATIQMVPYASSVFALPSKIINTLPSVKKIRSYVNEQLFPQVMAGEKLIIVARQKKAWELPVHPSILEIKGGLIRNARFEGDKRVLQKIWEFLKV